MAEKLRQVFMCQNLVFRAKHKTIVRDVSLQARRGEVVALLGPNGAGKTTSFSMLAGIIKPYSGNISINGVDITHYPLYQRAREGICYLPQEASVFKGLSVEDNIMSILEFSAKSAKDRIHHLESLLTDFRLQHVRKTNASLLSGGERRKVEIARALASFPQYILLDEPLAGVDPLAIHEMRNVIAHLKDKDIGVIITDHNVRDTIPICDYIYIMHNGQVITEGTREVIMKCDIAREIYFGDIFLQGAIDV